MILVQMYNIFRLLIGVPDYSISSESCGGKRLGGTIGYYYHKGVYNM